MSQKTIYVLSYSELCETIEYKRARYFRQKPTKKQVVDFLSELNINWSPIMYPEPAAENIDYVCDKILRTGNASFNWNFFFCLNEEPLH